MNVEETVEEPLLDMAMDVEEPILDDVVNDTDQPQDDADPKNDMSTWFKQPPRPKTPNPEWNKDLNVDNGSKQTWFNDLVNVEKDPLTFDDLMTTLIDFTKFAIYLLKKDKITKIDLVGPVYKLLKGTCRSSIDLEYNMEQCYLALSNQLDWASPEGDKCPYDLSKLLPLQGPLGNTKRKYYASITKTNVARYELEGIDDMIPRLWSPVIMAYDRNVELEIYH
ncbi:hypothetical protein Tco_1552465 [Tanacetum coccineum]